MVHEEKNILKENETLLMKNASTFHPLITNVANIIKKLKLETGKYFSGILQAPRRVQATRSFVYV